MAIIFVAGMLVLAACDVRHTGPTAAEEDEPQFRRGVQMLRSGHHQLAREAFLKVIDKRDGEAPESHLEVGQIYLNHIKDPYAAIYHFQRYLQQRPNSTKETLVRQMIGTAQKESIRGLPGNPMESEVERLDLLDKMQELKIENDSLRRQLASAGIAADTPPTLAPTGSPTQAQLAQQRMSPPPTRVQPREQTQTWADALPEEDLPVQTAIPVEIEPQQPARVTPQRPTAPASAAGRRYVVQPKDTLYGISKKLYGTNSRWRDIYEANRDRMRSETDLKIGMELRVP